MLTEYFPSSNKSLLEYTALPEYEGGPESSPEPRYDPSVGRSLFRWKLVAIGEFFVIAALLLVVYSKPQRDERPYSLVQEVITYEKRNFYNSIGKERTPYQGKPSPEVDELWSNLYDGGVVKISKEQERMLPNRTSAIPGDTDHYISSLSVFHHMHCLNFIRKSMWQEYYPEVDIRNATIFEHQEHCIDTLRQALMCNPDTTAAVWQWFPFDQAYFATWDTQHTCVDYTKLQKWASDHALYEFDEKVYVEGNPIHQPVYRGPGA